MLLCQMLGDVMTFMKEQSINIKPEVISSIYNFYRMMHKC